MSTATPDWDARFARDEYIFGTAPNAFLAAQAHRIPPGGRVLCVADGEGRNGVHLAQLGYAVESFDGSAVAVEKARRLAAERGVEVAAEVAGLDDWAWPPDRYDAVAAIFVQFSPPDMRRRMWARILETLKPGGLMLCEGYGVEQLRYRTGGPPDPAHLYTEALLREELAGYEVESIRAYEADVDEGPAHSGLSALVDAIARRPG
ncbi:MAG: class I SAM-dependent methyltransferase [Thermoleophilia bacterium]